MPECWVSGNLLSRQTWSLQTDLCTSVLIRLMHPGADFGLCSVQAAPRGRACSEELQMCPTLFHPYMLLDHLSPRTGSHTEGSIEVQPGSGRATPPCTHCQGHSPSLLEQQDVKAGGVDGPGHAGCIPSASAHKSVMLLSCLLTPAVFMPLVACS